MTSSSAEAEKARFISAHSPTLGGFRAEAVANVHYNMLHMGCRYPPDVEQHVQQLWKQLEADRSHFAGRQSEGTLPARSCASSSDATSFRQPSLSELAAPSTPSCSTAAAARVNECQQPLDAAPDLRVGTADQASVSGLFLHDFSDDILALAKRISMRASDSDLLLLAKLNESCMISNVNIDYQCERDERGHPIVHTIIDGVKVSSAQELNKKLAKQRSAQAAYKRLHAAQQLLGISEVPSALQVIQTAKKQVSQAELVGKAFHDADRIADDSRGSMLLKKMGYAGSGGLGKTGQGRSEPVVVLDQSTNRRGVGADVHGDLNHSQIEQLLKTFITSDEQQLVFGKDFTKENRAMVHKLCTRFALRHHSHGRGEARQLIVEKQDTSSNLSCTAGTKMQLTQLTARLGQEHALEYDYNSQQHTPRYQRRQSNGNSYRNRQRTAPY